MGLMGTLIYPFFETVPITKPFLGISKTNSHLAMKLFALGLTIASVHAIDRSMCSRPANTDLCSTLLTAEIIEQERGK